MNIVKEGIPVALCCDHAGYELKEKIKSYLISCGFPCKDFGTFDDQSCDYPDFAHPCAAAVERRECYPGIAMCGTGNGIAMTLNKHQAIRAALCWQPEIARLARAHNDANVLVMPARFVSYDEAIAILDTFLDTAFEGDRHQRRIDKIPNVKR